MNILISEPYAEPHMSWWISNSATFWVCPPPPFRLILTNPLAVVINVSRIALLQNIWVAQPLLDFWHRLRMHMPRESSVTAFRNVLLQYQQDHVLAAEPEALGVNMLQQVYEQYVLFMDETKRTVNDLFASETQTPFHACPSCYRECSGLSMDGNFKARRLKRASADLWESAEAGTGPFLRIPYSELMDYVQKRDEGERKSDCTSQFVVDDDNAKASAQYDFQVGCTGKRLLCLPATEVLCLFKNRWLSATVAQALFDITTICGQGLARRYSIYISHSRSKKRPQLHGNYLHTGKHNSQLQLSTAVEIKSE